MKRIIILIFIIILLSPMINCNNEIAIGESINQNKAIIIEDTSKYKSHKNDFINDKNINTIFDKPIESKDSTKNITKEEPEYPEQETIEITEAELDPWRNLSNNESDGNYSFYDKQENNQNNYSISLNEYINEETQYDSVLFNGDIPDFIKNLFFKEAFSFFASTRIDDTFGRFALDNYLILQPSRLSISSSVKMMIENNNLTQEEIEKNIYKDVVFPDLLITPSMLNNKMPSEIVKILFVFDCILNNKQVGSSFRKYYSFYPEEESIELSITKEQIRVLNLDTDILSKIIESIIKNIEFFETYTSYDFYKILNHPYMTQIVFKSFKKILSEDPLKINPGLFTKLDIEKEINNDSNFTYTIKNAISNGELRIYIDNNRYINSKFIKSVILITILYNYLNNSDVNIKNTESIINKIEQILPTTSESINDILTLCKDIFISTFPNSYIVTDKLIRLYYHYHLSAGISGMSYGSVSWSYKGYDVPVLTLISGDYRIYQMPMDTRKLIEIDNIYKQTREKDIFLPIFNFEYSDYADKALINVARPTYVNSYIFDFRTYQYKEVAEFFDRKIFTTRSNMNTTKTKIIAQSLNVDNELNDLLLINLRNYKTEKILSDCKIDNVKSSPSDRKLLITGNIDPDIEKDESKPYLYDMVRKELFPLPFIGDWNLFSWDLEEEWIYYIVDNKDLYRYDVVNKNNKRIFATELYIYHLSVGNSHVAFSYLNPDTGENRLILYNTQTRKSYFIDSIYNGVIRSGFSPDSNFLYYEVVNHEDFKDLYLLKIN